MSQRYHRAFSTSDSLASLLVNRRLADLDSVLGSLRDGTFEWENRTTIPSPPAAGYQRFYFRNGILYQQNSAGVETSIDLVPGYALLQDQKASGTGGGTTVGGTTIYTRDLNAIVSDDDSIITDLSSNQFTLEAGSYTIRAFAPGYHIIANRLTLYDVTNATDILHGPNVQAQNGGGDEVVIACCSGEFSITAQTVFELRHVADPAVPSANNFGYPASFGTEVYAQVMIWKQP